MRNWAPAFAGATILCVIPAPAFAGATAATSSPPMRTLNALLYRGLQKLITVLIAVMIVPTPSSSPSGKTYRSMNPPMR